MLEVGLSRERVATGVRDNRLVRLRWWFRDRGPTLLTCRYCGAQSDPARRPRFCRYCGEEILQPVICACGRESEPGARFCDGCGRSLANTDAVASTQVSAKTEATTNSDPSATTQDAHVDYGPAAAEVWSRLERGIEDNRPSRPAPSAPARVDSVSEAVGDLTHVPTARRRRPSSFAKGSKHCFITTRLTPTEARSIFAEAMEGKRPLKMKATKWKLHSPSPDVLHDSEMFDGVVAGAKCVSLGLGGSLFVNADNVDRTIIGTEIAFTAHATGDRTEVQLWTTSGRIALGMLVGSTGIGREFNFVYSRIAERDSSATIEYQ